MTGHFITFEGGEGSGKTTQSWALAERLEAEGQSVVLTREPGGAPGAEEIRRMLVEGDPDRWSAEAETLLFFAARDNHLNKIIRPALSSGKWVVCDRFTDSTYAYQGAQKRNLEGFIKSLEDKIVGDTRPELTFILDLHPATGLDRTQARPDSRHEDRFERKGAAFHKALRQAFLAIAARDKNRCHILDAAKSAGALEREIWQIVADRFQLNQR
jgi:dTMP kinase